MKGVIAHINESRGMVAVATGAGDFSILELMGGDSVAVDDVVRWSGDAPLGSELTVAKRSSVAAPMRATPATMPAPTNAMERPDWAFPSLTA